MGVMYANVNGTWEEVMGQAGPTGPAGPSGAAGPTGPTGPTGTLAGFPSTYDELAAAAAAP